MEPSIELGFQRPALLCSICVEQTSGEEGKDKTSDGADVLAKSLPASLFMRFRVWELHHNAKEHSFGEISPASGAVGGLKKWREPS